MTRHYREALNLRGHTDKMDAQTICSLIQIIMMSCASMSRSQPTSVGCRIWFADGKACGRENTVASEHAADKRVKV